MARQDKLREEIQDIIDDGERPSARLLADQMNWSEADIHRCLNILERKGEIKSYRKEVMKGKKMRMVGLRR